MIDNERLLGALWEQFWINDTHVGFTHRVTKRQADGTYQTRIVLSFAFDTMVSELDHTIVFRNEAGLPWQMYRFVQNGVEVVRSASDVPVGHPSYAEMLFVLSLPLTTGASVRFNPLEDSSGEPTGEAQFNVGTEEDGVWRVDGTLNGQPANTYWLNEQRLIVKVDWQGAVSIRVPDQETAVQGLSAEMVERAQQAAALLRARGEV